MEDIAMNKKIITDEIFFFYNKEDIKKRPSVYELIFYFEGGKCLRYIGSAYDALKRTIEHYHTDLKNEFCSATSIELKILRNCDSRIEAYYYEKLYIKSLKKVIKSKIVDIDALVKHTNYIVEEYSKMGYLNKIG